MNIPNIKNHKFNKQNKTLWIYTIGKLYTTEKEAKKEKEKGFRFTLYKYNFYNIIWYKYEINHNKSIMLSLYNN